MRGRLIGAALLLGELFAAFLLWDTPVLPAGWEVVL